MTEPLVSAAAEADEAAQTAEALLDLLPALNRLVAAAVQREAGADTTMPQFRVLSMLAARPQTLSELARARRVSLQSLGTLVQALVERGWIVRVANPNDRRQHMLSLSESGRTHYDQARARTLQALLPLVAVLDRESLRAVQQALPALDRALKLEDTSHGDTTAR